MQQVLTHSLFLFLIACSSGREKKPAPESPQGVDQVVTDSTKTLAKLEGQARSYFDSDHSLQAVDDQGKTLKEPGDSNQEPTYFAYQAALGPDARVAAPPPRPTGAKGVEDFDSLVRGVSQEELVGRFGPASETSQFMATEGVGEMRVELLNDYPVSDPASSKTEIIEKTWNGEGYTFVLWLHRKEGAWVGLQALSYLDGVEF